VAGLWLCRLTAPCLASARGQAKPARAFKNASCYTLHAGGMLVVHRHLLVALPICWGTDAAASQWVAVAAPQAPACTASIKTLAIADRLAR
jgi:hypothetical protein